MLLRTNEHHVKILSTSLSVTNLEYSFNNSTFGEELFLFFKTLLIKGQNPSTQEVYKRKHPANQKQEKRKQKSVLTKDTG
jgi:hypothetical protein